MQGDQYVGVENTYKHDLCDKIKIQRKCNIFK